MRCNNCGAPQANNKENICEFCGGDINSDLNDKSLIQDFNLIKYEYAKYNFDKVVKLCDNYLKKDINNIPAWSYKIISESSCNSNSHELSFDDLNHSLETLSSLGILNNDNRIVLESQLINAIQKIDFYTILSNADEINTFTKYAAKNFSKEFNDWFSQKIQEKPKYDPLFAEAAQLIVSNQIGSTSLIQRKLNLGYADSGRLMVQLELAKIVGPNMGSKSREVLVKTSDDLNKILTDIGLEINNLPNTINAVTNAQNAEINNNSKASLPSKGNDKSGCFIATATMGSYDHPVVMDLRQFRDNWLLKRTWGVKFAKWYYTHGPKAAGIIEGSAILRKLSCIFIVKPLQRLANILMSFTRQ